MASKVQNSSKYNLMHDLSLIKIIIVVWILRISLWIKLCIYCILFFRVCTWRSYAWFIHLWLVKRLLVHPSEVVLWKSQWPTLHDSSTLGFPIDVLVNWLCLNEILCCMKTKLFNPCSKWFLHVNALKCTLVALIPTRVTCLSEGSPCKPFHSGQWLPN